MHLQELGEINKLQKKYSIGPFARDISEACGINGDDGTGAFSAEGTSLPLFLECQ